MENLTMSEVNSENTEPQTVSGVEEQAKPTLSLQDLTLMVQILQVGTKRGAWKAGELSSVGVLYDRITAFLNAAGVQTKSDDDEDQSE